MVDFWTPSESDLRPELPRRPVSCKIIISSNKFLLPQTVYLKTAHFFQVVSDTSTSGTTSPDLSRSNRNSEEIAPPNCTAVQLTLELSNSCERLHVAVDQGHDWVGFSLLLN